MTGRGRSTKRAKKRGRPPVPIHPQPASSRNKWILAAAVLTVVVLTALLVATKARRRAPQQPAPAPPIAGADQTNVSAPPKVELGPEEKVAALKAEELRFAQQLIETFPNSEQPLVLLGDVYRRRGAFDQAVNVWEKAIQMNPKRSDVYDKIAQSAFETDEFEKAISLWRKALDVNPAMRGGHANIARSLMRLGQYQESISELQEEAGQHPDMVLSYFLLGRAHQHLQDYEKAKANYERAVELQPDHMNAYYGLYNVCARLKLQEDAKRYLAEFKRLQKLDAQANLELDEAMTDLKVYSRGLARLSFEANKLYRAIGDMPRAEELLKKAIGLDPENTTFIERLIVLYRGRNRIPEALAWCHRIAEIDPENVTCQLNIGILSARMGRFEAAEKAFRKAIELSPEHYGGYQELSRLLLRLKGNLPEARELARRAVELEANAENHYVLGLACLANRDSAGALAALKQAAKLEPQNLKYTNTYRNIKRGTESR